MLTKNSVRAAALFLIALFLILPLAGCGSKTTMTDSPSAETATDKDKEFDLVRVQFHDIVVMVPDTLVDSSFGSEDQLDLSLPESAQDPFAFSMHLFVNEDINYTAKDAYENVAEFEEDAKLIEANGIDFLVQQERHSNFSSTSILLTLDDTGYSIYIDYQEGLGQAYERYVSDICQHISTTAGPQPSASPSIPAGAINWEEAQSHIGENVTIYGPIVETKYVQKVNGQPTYLNIGVAYPDTNGVTALIWGEDRGAFDHAPESTYKGKTICVTGEPYMYKGQCYIKVTSPHQIEILQ